MENYFFFLMALYILTFGLAFLETTANPFIMSMRSEETATRRLNLAQAFNPIGALSGLFVAQTFILGALQSDDLDANGNSVYETLSESAKAAVKTSDLAVIRDPYVGLGLNMTLFFDEDGAADRKNHGPLNNSFGLAVSGGLNYNIDDHWMANAAVWYIDIDSELDTLKKDVEIDPIVVMAGVGYKF